MREWLNAQEIAELKLAGMPASRFGVQRLADRQQWHVDERRSRQRQERGGGIEYHFELLPLPARVDYFKRHLAVDPTDDAMRREAAAEPGASALSSSAAAQRDARLAVLKSAEDFHRHSGLSLIASDCAFARIYNAGNIAAPEWVREAIKQISARSIARWRAHRKAGETKRLGVDRAAARKGKGALDIADGGGVRTFIFALLIQQPMISAKNVRRLVRARYGDLLPGHLDEALPLPPLRTFQHFLKSMRDEHKIDLVALTNPDAFRSQYRIAGRGSLRHVTRAGQLWMIDASPADALLVDGRHSVYLCVDIATRRLKVYVSKTPRASAVGLLMRRAILDWGVPEAVKTDNGSDFTAKATERLFADLDIEAITSTAFQPQEKGHIERAIGTFQRDLMQLCPGFIGHSVSDRKAIESRKSFADRLGEQDRDTFAVELTADRFQTYCDEWADNLYAHEPHDGLHGRTPFDVASESRDAIRTVEPRALDMLLAPIAGKDGYRTATKSGIRIDGNYYLAPAVQPETRVFVRRDPADLGRLFLFSDAGGDYLGEAICPRLAGIDPAEAVKAARAEQSRILAERTREAKAEARRMTKGPHLVELVLGQARKDRAGVVAFPKPSVAHSTPQIDAAKHAANAAERPVAPTPIHSPEALAMHARLASEPALRPVRAAPRKTDMELMTERWERALRIEAAIQRGDTIPETDLRWHAGYSAGPEYRGLDMTHRGSLSRERSTA